MNAAEAIKAGTNQAIIDGVGKALAFKGRLDLLHLYYVRPNEPDVASALKKADPWTVMEHTTAKRRACISPDILRLCYEKNISQLFCKVEGAGRTIAECLVALQDWEGARATLPKLKNDLEAYGYLCLAMQDVHELSAATTST